jgi:hypothetical protein
VLPQKGEINPKKITKIEVSKMDGKTPKNDRVFIKRNVKPGPKLNKVVKNPEKLAL